ncbi:MAG: FtsW/RodA/SpoVE family cell cycle protein, partial [Chloroflexota bacterium]
MANRYSRWTELSLIPAPIAFLALGLSIIGITLPDNVSQEHLLGAGLATFILIATHITLAWRCPRSDQILLPIVAMLTSIGLVMVARLAPDLALRQAFWVILGLFLAVVTVSFLPSVTLLQRYKYTSAVLGFALVAATFLFGVDPNQSGSRLWLPIGSHYFQPSEILKLLLVIFLTGYLDDKRELLSWSSSRLGGLKLPPLPYLGPFVVMWAVSMLLLIAQRDLGATLLLFGVFLSMLYMASCRAMYAWGGLSAFLGGAYICFLLFSHVQIRVNIWLDPWSRAQEEGF